MLILKKFTLKKIGLLLGNIIIAVMFFVLYIPEHPLFAISNGPDEIYFEKPTEGEIIAGVYQLKWYMRDDQQGYPPFQIDLFSKACAENQPYYGTVEDSNPVIVGQNGHYTVSWNTQGAIQNKPSVPDDYYCMRICATFVQLKKGRNNYYSLCDKHTIRVANNANQPPVISSNPGNLNIKVGETFSYQVVASDPNSLDKLTYELVSAPQFLTINAASGYIITIGTISQPGSYSVTVRVVDDRGASIQQVFTLNVSASGAVSRVLTIEKPAANDVFSKGIVNINWKLSSEEGLEKMVLSYSSDGNQWQKIIELTAKEQQGSYEWDVAQIPAGQYYLKIEAIFTDGETVALDSSKFEITKPDDQSGESVPFISELKPEADAKISETLPDIGANYTPSEGAEIVTDKVAVELDDKVLNDCQALQDKVICKPSVDLEIGRHKVKVSVEDSAAKKETKEWFFEVVTILPTVEPTPSSEFQVFGRNIPQNIVGLTILIICCGFLLLIIPWILFLRASRKESESVQVKQQLPPQGYQPSDIYGSGMLGQQTYTVTPQMQDTYEQTLGGNYQAAPSVADASASEEVPEAVGYNIPSYEPEVPQPAAVSEVPQAAAVTETISLPESASQVPETQFPAVTATSDQNQPPEPVRTEMPIQEPVAVAEGPQSAAQAIAQEIERSVVQPSYQPASQAVAQPVAQEPAVAPFPPPEAVTPTVTPAPVPAPVQSAAGPQQADKVAAPAEEIKTAGTVSDQEPQVGTQTLGVDQGFEPVATESQYTSPLPQNQAEDSVAVKQPEYITDEEIPDWLKTPQGDKPITPTGMGVGKNAAQQLDEDMSALPHEDYDIENRPANK